MESQRYKIALQKLREIEGDAADKALGELESISPDLARLCIEYPLGDIYSRPGLDIKKREVATIAALTVLGNTKPQLAIHIKAALRIGLTREEILEIILQMSIFSGFPSAINATLTVKEVFDSIDTENK